MLARLSAFLLLVLLGVGHAQAQNGSDQHDDQGAAYAHCMSSAHERVANWMATEPRQEPRIGARTCQLLTMTSGQPYGFQERVEYRARLGAGQYGSFLYADYLAHTFPIGKDCASRGSKPPTLFSPPSGSLNCQNGCEYKYRETGDGETMVPSPTGKVCDEKPDCASQGSNYVWNGYLNVCQPVEPECPAGSKAHGSECVKEDSCPDGMALQNGVCKKKEDTCPAGQTRAPDGSCVEKPCPAGQVKGSDGTCKKDDDDDGQEDEGEEESFSGGDNCDTPPACSGSPILCGQARIQWRIECNTRHKANISGGHCGAGGMPVCAGDGCKAVEHAQLVQQWKAACYLEKLAGGENSGGGQNDVTAEYLAALRAADKADADASAAAGDGHEGVSESSIFKQFSNSSFNPNLFGGQGAGQCAFGTPLEILGRPIVLPPEWWTLATMIGWLMVACAYLWVAFQLGS